MKYYLTFYIFLFLINTITYSQDFIIKKNGEEIKSKVTEVNISIVKHKKFENLNGPVFEILKDDIFLIKYENGTKDVFNAIQSSENQNTRIEKMSSKKNVNDNSMLVFTENHRSTTLMYGFSALLGLSGFVNDVSLSSYAIGPIMLLKNKAISKKFSFNYGPALMYYHEDLSYSGYKNNFNLIFTAVTFGSNYHFLTTEKYDPYCGLQAGLGYFFAVEGDNYGGSGSLKGTFPLVYGTKAGLNIYNQRKTSAWTFEVGYDFLSYLKIGYTFAQKR